jgi:hypothetical protein
MTKIDEITVDFIWVILITMVVLFYLFKKNNNRHDFYD